MCQKLSVSRASYYRWLKPGSMTEAQALRAKREELVEAAFEVSNNVSGAGQIVDILRNKYGHKICKATVLSIMKQLGIQAKRATVFKKTTKRDPKALTAHISNELADKEGITRFYSLAPGAVLAGDITYLKTGEGWVYLATVIDLYSRMVVGWSMSDRMQTQLVIDAMEMARGRGFIRSGTVFHSDRGAQYTGKRFQVWCAGNGVTQSMGETGSAYDNAVAESFFSSLKNEMYHAQVFKTRAAVRTAVMEYIEVWFNRERPHTANKGLTPLMMLEKHRTGLMLAA